MSYQCSAHRLPMTLQHHGDILLWKCPVPECQHARPCKFGRRNLKSKPARQFLALVDKLPCQRDRVRRERGRGSSTLK
jgi:hypothetical protein